jgi:hypothetical protein
MISLDKPDLRVLVEQMAEAGRLASEALRNMVPSAHSVAQARAAHRARTPGTPEWLLAQQYPVFRCPQACGVTWDRTRIDDGELRSQLWDHAHAHVPGEAGHPLGDRWTRRVRRAS